MNVDYEISKYLAFITKSIGTPPENIVRALNNDDMMKVVKTLYACQDLNPINVQGFIDCYNAFKCFLSSNQLAETEDKILKRSELLKLNRIVCTDCVNDVPQGYELIGKWKDIDDKLDNGINDSFSNSIYSILPPFEEGVYEVELNNMKGFSGKKGKSYFHYKVKDVDSYNQTFTLDVDEYHRKNCAGIGCWVKDYSSIINAEWDSYSQSVSIGLGVVSVDSMVDSLSEFLMRPDKKKKELLTQVIELNNFDVTNYMKGLISLIRVSNYIIDSNSPKTKYTRSSTPRTSRTASAAYVEAENTISPPVTRIYVDSALSVVSKQKPKRITPENIRKVYKTLAWDRRGHVRQYKSGKTVWVKQTTCHRQGGDDKDVKPRTIKIEGGDR